MVTFESALFYLSVLAITETMSLGLNRNRKFCADDYMTNHASTKCKYKRHKRGPMCRSFAQLPQGMNVLRPSRPGDGTLGSPEEADRFKEVVHIPCPKIMSSNSRSVAAPRGLQELLTNDITENERLLKVAPDNKCQEPSQSTKTNQNPGQPNDLNEAVKQNQQWFISSQGSNQPQIGQNCDKQGNTANPSPNQQNRRESIGNQQEAISDRYYIGQGQPNQEGPPIEKPIEAYKNTPKQMSKNNYDPLSPQQQMDIQQVKMKSEGSVPQSQQIAGGNVPYLNSQIQKPHDPVPNAGLNQLPATPYDTKAAPGQPPQRNEIAIPVANGQHQYFTNPNNLTHEAPRNTLQPLYPPYQLPPNSNSSNELIPLNQPALYCYSSQNNTNRGMYNRFKNSNLMLPKAPPLNYNSENSGRAQASPPNQHTCNKHDQGLSSTGELDIKNEMISKKNPGQSQGQLEIEARNHEDGQGGVHVPLQLPQQQQGTKSGQENWKEFKNLQSERSHEPQRIPLTVSNPVDNKEKAAIPPVNVEKPAHGLAAIKGLFGKFNKEEVKARQVPASSDSKQSKSRGYNENPLIAINVATGNPVEVANGYVSKNEKALVNGKGGVVVVVERTNRMDNANSNNAYGRTKVDGPGQNNIVMRNERYYNQMDALKGHYDPKPSIDQAQAVRYMQNYTDTRNYGIITQRKRGNVSSSMLHILNPPVTVEPHQFTNVGLKMVSKVPINEEATYHSFMGFAPARNDEAFYDKKNMNFLTPIDHAPLISLKWKKAGKTEKHLKSAYKNYKGVPGKCGIEFYSQENDLQNDKTAEDFPRPWKRFKQARFARKCHRKHKTFWQHIKGQDKRGLQRSKVSSSSSVK